MASCKPEDFVEAFKGIECVEAVERALSGEGVRIRVRDEGFALARLPKELLEKLSGCNVVEVVYPSGRVVYIKDDVVKRLVR